MFDLNKTQNKIIVLLLIAVCAYLIYRCFIMEGFSARNNYVKGRGGAKSVQTRPIGNRVNISSHKPGTRPAYRPTSNGANYNKYGRHNSYNRHNHHYHGDYSYRNRYNWYWYDYLSPNSWWNYWYPSYDYDNVIIDDDYEDIYDNDYDSGYYVEEDEEDEDDEIYE